MSEAEFILPSTTNAIIHNSDSSHLFEQKQRVESAVVSEDPALVLDTSKALLETVYKTILNDILSEPDISGDMGSLYRDVKTHMVFNHDKFAREKLEHLIGNINHFVPELRNKFGAASHGKDGNFQNPIEMPEAEMITYLVDGVAGFLLKRNRILANPEYSQRIYYTDYEEFNDYLDTSNNPIDFGITGSEPIPHSLALFNCDPKAYQEYLIQFKEEETIIEISTNPELTEMVPVAENQHD